MFSRRIRISNHLGTVLFHSLLRLNRYKCTSVPLEQGQETVIAIGWFASVQERRRSAGRQEVRQGFIPEESVNDVQGCFKLLADARTP